MMPTIIISLIIASALAVIIVRGIINKKNGKPSCSCGCSGCALRDKCHK